MPFRRTPCLGLALATLFACRSSGPPAEPPRPVKVQRVAEADASGGLRYSASLAPMAQVVLAFKVGGYVDRIPQRPGADGKARPLQGGDAVKKGDELARLREADYQHKVAEARAQRDAAATAAERAKGDYIRAQELFKGEGMSRSDMEHARAGAEGAQEQLDMADAELRTAELALRDCVLRAPMDGVILQRSVEVGALASPGTPGFALADLSQVKAAFGVPEAVVGRLAVGLDLDLRLTGERGGETMRGTITSIAPAADALSRVFPVEVSIPNPRGALRSGAVVTVEIPGTLAGGPVTTVPVSAVVRGPAGKGYAVFVVEGAEGKAVARLRKVELGDIAGSGVAVLGGLKGGDPVVTLGATLLTDGAAVRVLE